MKWCYVYVVYYETVPEVGFFDRTLLKVLLRNKSVMAFCNGYKPTAVVMGDAGVIWWVSFLVNNHSEGSKSLSGTDLIMFMLEGTLGWRFGNAVILERPDAVAGSTAPAFELCSFTYSPQRELFVLRRTEFLIKTVHFQSCSRHCRCNMFVLRDQAQRFTFISGSENFVDQDYIIGWTLWRQWVSIYDSGVIYYYLSKVIIRSCTYLTNVNIWFKD